MEASRCTAMAKGSFVATAAAETEKPSAPKSAKPQDPELRGELHERTQKDQAARNAWIEWTKQHPTDESGQPRDPEQKIELEKLLADLRKIDEANKEWLKQIVTNRGWPTISLVGRDGASAAWLLVQHADHDPQFQRKCLDLMTALPKDEVSQTNLAYLTDRVQLKEGKPQRYGTQFTSENGHWKPQPLEDESNVDARRTALGLPPLAEYARQLADVYGPAFEK
jgi:hypothetical protein